MEPEGRLDARVSVLMALHGETTWLSDALNSLSRQTFKSWDFLCVLDGSNDEAERILIGHGTRFQYEVAPKPVGAAEARNRAMRLAAGDFIAILDSDDVWPENHLAEHVFSMNSDHNLVLVGTSAELIDEDGMLTGENRLVRRDRLPQQLLSRNVFVHSSTMYRRDAALSVGGYDPLIRVVEDLHLWLKLAPLGRIDNQPSRSIQYRIHPNQTSRQTIDDYSLTQIRNERLLLARHIGVGPLKAMALGAAWEVSQRSRRILNAVRGPSARGHANGGSMPTS